MSRRLADMLAEFHTRPGVDITPPPAPTLDVPGLRDRHGYLQDEVNELLDALDAGDVEAYADALADITYVVFGSAWRTGIPLPEVLEAVHASNMTKTASSGDGKAVKGPGYRPPDIPAAFAAAARHAAARELRAGRPATGLREVVQPPRGSQNATPQQTTTVRARTPRRKVRVTPPRPPLENPR